jgi:protein-tyrosine-phosphatase
MRAESHAVEILFVCSGNTCRSPMAEAVARRLIATQRLPCSARSAGIAALEGAPASTAARQVAAEAGLDLSSHRARLLTPGLVSEAALVLVMGSAHRECIRRLAPEAMARVQLLRDYAERREGGPGIADPFGEDAATYQRTLREIEPLVEQSLKRFCAEAETRREASH